MKKRPLLVALMIVVVFIIIEHYLFEKKEIVELSDENISFVCEVEQIQSSKNGLAVIAKDVVCEGAYLCDRVRLYPSNNDSIFDSLKIGNQIFVSGKINSFETGKNPGQFDEKAYNKNLGISYKVFVQSLIVKNKSYSVVQNFLYQLRKSFEKNIYSCLDEENAGVVIAMILGDKASLSDEIKSLYTDNGIAHILAISGLHISIIGAGIFFFLRKYIMHLIPAAIITISLLLLYGEMTGFSVSTKRAIVMMACMLFAKIAGRKYDLFSSISLSAIIQLLMYRESLFQAGFLLSYGTVLGIGVFVNRFVELSSKLMKFVKKHEKIAKKILEVIFSSFGVYLVTLPIVMYFYYQIPVYSFAINIVVIFLLTGLVSLSIIGAFVAFCSVVLARFIFGASYFILRFYNLICNFVSYFPGYLIITGKPLFFQIVLYYVGIILFCILYKSINQKVLFIILMLSMFVLFFDFKNHDKLIISNLDVGQGDCTCIQFKDQTILIDGGSSSEKNVEKYRIVPFLKYYGIDKIDYIFLTHSDEDHVVGVTNILKNPTFYGLKIGKVVMSAIKNKDDNYKMIEKICHDRGVQFVTMCSLNHIAIGELEIKCIHPCKDYECLSPNNYSLVLEVDYRKFKGLFTGDAEFEAEDLYIDFTSDINYLKVAHHGSKGATSTNLLKKIQPEISTISVGKNNRYGHPSEELIKRLEKVGTKIYRTDKNGCISLFTDGYTIDVECFG